MAVRKEKNKNTWYVQTSFVNYMGERKRTTKRGFRTKRTALEWEEEFKRSNSGCKDMTLNSLYERYKEDNATKIRITTWDNKNNIVETKILPFLGNRKINEITPSDIRAWQNQIMAMKKKNGKPYAPSYLRTINNQLNALFHHAKRFYGLRDVPTEVAGSMGSTKCEEKEFWTFEEYSKFLKEVANKPESYYGFELLYWCGLRIGELLALTPADFNFDNNTFEVCKSYSVTSEGPVIGPTKTDNDRTVLMPEFIAREIRMFIDSFYEIGDNDRIFSRSDTFYRHELERGSKAAGVKILSPHELRHSHITNLMSMGFNAVEIGNRVGQESEKITYNYAHSMPANQKKMINTLDIVRREMDDEQEE